MDYFHEIAYFEYLTNVSSEVLHFRVGTTPLREGDLGAPAPLRLLGRLQAEGGIVLNNSQMPNAAAQPTPKAVGCSSLLCLSLTSVI